MCRIFKIVYACGHRDIVTAPCEWRDEGRVDILGRRVPCENSTRNLADLSRLCMACSLVSDGQNLVNLNSSTRPDNADSYIACDEKDVVATIVRNESHLRRRTARRARVLPTPPISMSFPTSSELHHQLCVNGEFLARRIKRRHFQAHLDGRGEYQDFLEASQAHLDARGALNNSIFTIETSAQATSFARTGQDGAAPAVRTKTATAATHTDDIEEVEERPSHPSPPSSPESDDSSMTIRSFRPRAPSPPSAGILSEFLLDDEELDFMLSREEGEESCSLIGSSIVESYDQEEHLNEDQITELSDLVNGLSNEADRGRPRPDPPQAKITLNSPEGVARLADIRLFLGMRSDTAPLDIWNFAIRNDDLMGFITGNTLPIRHRNMGAARRPGFDRDPGLETVLDYADDRWELRTGFLGVWDSLDWNFEAPSWPAPDAPGSSTDENDGVGIESTIDESCPGFDIPKFINVGITIDDLNVEHETEQGDDSAQRREEKGEEKEYFLEGRCARRHSEVGFDGKPRVPKHQVRNASRLRMSWKYTDPENPVLSPSSKEGPISPPSSLPISRIFQDDSTSPMLSPPAYPTSLNMPEVPFFSALLSSLTPSNDDAIPHLSLEDNQVSVEPENPPQQTTAQQELASWHAADGDNSEGSISHSVLEPNGPPTVFESCSTVGKRMLGFLRQSLAMPDSRTPQEISTFITLHPGLMRAIRGGHVPVREPAMEVSGKKPRQRRTWARFDPLYSLPVARRDRRQRFMQANLAMALNGLDWDQIDSVPTPVTASSPWDGYSPRADRKRLHSEEEEKDDDDDEEEEECDHWVRTKVRPRHNKFSEYHSSYVMKHQVKTPSPLRTMLTRRGPGGGEAGPVQVDAGKGLLPAQGDTREPGSDTPEPEVWDDVDLNASGSLSENGM